MLRIGRIAYANCTPIFSVLQAKQTESEFQFTCGVPAQLNGLLAEGTIDVCPSSSFEYALRPDHYLILPHLSISSAGPVGSVLLFSKVPLEKLNGSTVFLSTESATSVNLLKVLLKKYLGIQCTYALNSSSLDGALIESSALLLIGDAALRESQRLNDLYIYDLGKLWFEWTGLPFVFALWLCRRTAADERYEEVSTLAGLLAISKEEARNNLDAIAEISDDVQWMGRDRLIAYWRENISYDLGEEHVKGLKLFYRYCSDLGLLPSEPVLHFFDDTIRKDF